MAYANNKITGAVSIHDVMSAVPVTLQRTVNGVVQKKVSSDLTVLCSAKVGDTIPASDGNGNWTVIGRTDINMWAKYRPIPCFNGDTDGDGNTLNKPTPLTLDDRVRLSYGLHVFYEDSSSSYLWDSFIAAAASSLNQGAKITDLTVIPRSWNNPTDPYAMKQWRRLTDFVSHPNDDAQRTLGYYHEARPYYPIWKAIGEGDVEHGTYEIGLPLISETERERFEILIGSGQALVLPDDQFYLHAYEGDTFVEGGVTMRVVKQNDDPLSISALDAIINAGNWLAVNTQNHNNLSTHSIRGVAILVRAFDAGADDVIWAPFGTWERSARQPYSQDGEINPILELEANNSNGIGDIFLPRTDLGDTYAFYTNQFISVGQQREKAQWKDLEGLCAFLEYYRENDGGSYLLPIAGYTYYVNIFRVSIPSGAVDYAGKFVEWTFVTYEELGCVLAVAVDFDTVTDITSALAGNNYYTSLILVISNSNDGSNPIVSKSLKNAEWNSLTNEQYVTIDGHRYKLAIFVFENTSSLSSGNYYWVLKATKEGGSTGVLASGVMEI